MLVFYILVFLLVAEAFIIPQNKEYGKRLYLIVAFIELQLVSGMRIPLGGDSEYYTDLFVDVSQANFNELFEIGLEKGFIIFNYLVSIISNNPQAIIFFSSFLLNGLILYYIYKKSKAPWLSVVLYVTLMFYFNAMNLMRFMIACAILLYSIDFVVGRKPLKFFLILLLATSFHFSSLMFGVVYIIYNIRLSWKSLCIISVPFCLLSLFFFSAFQFLIQFNERYAYYSDNGDFYQSAYANILEFLICFFIFLFFVYKKKWRIKNLEGEERVYLWMAFLSAVFSYLAISVMIVLRFSYLFSLCYIIFIANLISETRYPSRQRWICLFLIASFLKMTVILTFRPEWYFGEPYKNWLF